jgi:two-component system cell cycle sensor histidine kinase/response regulator CckA
MENPLRILIIEDNESDAALIIRHIKKAEPNITYDVIETSIQMEAALEQHHWDFIICDYSLPQFNAINALKLFRSKMIDIPFIVISGSVGEETAVELMKAGAHDYIMKNNLARLVPVFHRELAEAEIRRKNKRVEARNIIQGKLLDLIGQSVIVVDESDTITYWNNASKDLYGWSDEEVIGHRLKEIMTNHNSQSQSYDVKKSIKNGESWSKETEVLNKDGLSIPVHITHTPIFDENGDLKGVIGISYDISERRKSENAFLRKMDELAASNQELQRINRLTIGREMRMIELKQQCNNLAAKLGMNQPYPLTFINETDQQKKK